ncbi:hypothetical protein FACS1894172_14870 [Spirochaetia bacterium]|nr:hypothetical protein FACS1894172_14870 [Spirochaetia bacterium]
MSLFPTHQLILRHKTEGRYERGRWIAGDPIDTVFYSSWQPVTGKALEQLPEGKRSGEVYKAFPSLDLEFTPADAHAGAEADVIVWRGKSFEVTVASRWDNGILPHWELICTRPKEGET